MRRTIVLLVLVGLAVSGYLLSRHLALMGGAAGRSVCSVVLRLDCDRALSSPASSAAGLPLAGWGVVYFGTLAALLVLGHAHGEPFRATALRACLALALLGAAAGVVLSALMAFGTAPFCPLCAAVHAVSVTLVPLLARASGRPIRALPGEIRAACATVLRSAAPMEPSARLALTSLLCAGLAALVLAQSVFTLEEQRKPPPPEVAKLAAVGRYAMGPRIEMPAVADEERFGPASAAMQLVVFSDFECPGCRLFAKRVAKMTDSPNGRVSAVFRHFPVDCACNGAVKETRHPHACAAAFAAEAARMQGRFRVFHDALFGATAPLADDELRAAARRAGLDLAKFDADRNSDEARRRVAADVALGIRLGVKETPAVYLNGRRVPDISGPALSMAMMSEANGKPRSLEKEPDASAPDGER